MKKVVAKVELQDEKAKQKAFKGVAGLPGVDSISIDMKDKKVTITGNVDPVEVVNNLRKVGHTEIVSVGENKKEEPKNEEGKKNPNKQMAELIRAFQSYNPYLTMHYYVQSVEEDPNACVIC